jgi:hypothetical protein
LSDTFLGALGEDERDALFELRVRRSFPRNAVLM